MEAFIEGVRKQPCLWNPLHPDYREMHIKDEAWQNVVDHFNSKTIPNIQVAKIEWKKLRDNHRDALKRAKLGKNKLLPAQVTTWKYAKAMQFLEPHMKYRITENIEMEPSNTSIKKTVPNYHESDVSTTEHHEAAESSPAKRRCLEKPRRKDQDDNALDSFFKCMLESTKVMPFWMQTQVKKKIFGIIIDAEEQLSISYQGQQETTTLTTDQSDHGHESSLPLESMVKTEIHTDESCDELS